MTPVGPSSPASASSYGASPKGLKYPTSDGSHGQEKVEDFLNISTLNSLSNKDLVRFPHCGAALTRLQHLRSTDNIPLGEIEEAGIREDEADFLPVFPAAEPPVFSKNRNRRNSSPQATKALVVFAVSHTCGRNAQRRGALAARLVVGHVRAPAVALKAFHQAAQWSQATSTWKKCLFRYQQANAGGADHSIMSRAFALVNGIIMQPLDPPIATLFASNSSEVIRFATEPLQLQCQGHRSFVQRFVSNGASLDLLLGLDWLQQNNSRVDWDHGSLMLSDSDHCCKWEAVYSDAEFRDDSVAIRLCTAR
ncbi:hypothetical protein Efla_006025 [Eimeria flavescens]